MVGCATARATATFTSPDAGDAIGVEVTGLGLTGWDAHNYVLASTSATTTADIAPAILTVIPDAQTLTYGAAAPAYTFAVTGFQNGETPATASNYVAPSATSTYFSLTTVASSPVKITCAGGSADNYTFDTGASANLTITPAILTPDTHRQQQDLRRHARRHDHRLQPYRGHRR